MQRNDEVLTVEPCDICGDVGYPELLVTCSKCNVIHAHCYCMQILLNEVPDVWFCESCQSKNGTTSPCKVNQDAGLQATKRQQTVRTGRLMLMTRKAYVGSISVTPKNPSVSLKSNPCISPMVHGKCPRNEVQKNQMTDLASHSSSKDMPRTRGGRVPDSAYRQAHPTEEPQRDEPQHFDEIDGHTPIARETFSGGPFSRLVLTEYEHHVAREIWLGRDRGPLKVHAHGKKLKDWLEKIGPIPPNVMDVIRESRLSSLLNCSFTMTDSALVSAFAERWHGETSSFHLPFGEMTITLDDVSCLLHLPVDGAFFSNPVMDEDDAISYLQVILGVSRADARFEVEHVKGGNMSFLFLQKVYDEACEAQNWVIASRAFIMHLLGCTILTNKSQTGIDIKYLDLVRDLERCKTWSWGSIALCVLYQYLTDASMSNTKQIAGYMTLLQAWIFEHFPTICSRKERRGYTEDNCRAMRWLPRRGTGQLLPFRSALDALTTARVSWTPYTEHRPYVPLEELSSFSGYLRFSSITVPHLPERVLRQFGFVQDIPRPPIPVPTTEVLDYCWIHYDMHSVRNTVCLVNAEVPSQCTNRYLRWFYSMSHPYLIPRDSENRVHDSQTESVAEAQFVEQPKLYVCCNDSCFDTKKRLYEIAGILQTMAYTESDIGPTAHNGDIKRLLRIVHGGTEAGPSSSRNVFGTSSGEE